MKKTIAFLISVIIIISCSFVVLADNYNDSDVAYPTYIYNDDNKPVVIPTAYRYIGKIEGDNVSKDGFGELSDLFYSKDEDKLYVADSASNSIIILNKDFTFNYVLKSFDNDGKEDKFKAPQGICVRDGILYVADTENSRIVTFDTKNYKLIKEYNKPCISQLGSDYTYKPVKLAVGITGQMYVIGQSINNGFIVLDESGEFQSFVGAPTVKTNFIDEIWKMFMTKKQKESMLKNVPTEYNSVVFDKEGFLYATTQSADVQPISRLNLQGSDILLYNTDYPQGDSLYKNKISTFVDVDPDENGNYYALDSASGRVFTYNRQGNLLFAFGTKGNQGGTLTSPCAIEVIDDSILVADAVSGVINIYSITSFASSIIKADLLLNNGEYDEAKDAWTFVERKCNSYTLATNSLGQIALYEKDYKLAMKYFLSSYDKKGYSNAFRGLRTQFIYSNYGYIFIVVLTLLIISIVYKKIISKKSFIVKLKQTKLCVGMKYANYCIFHPFDGFWCLKREKRGNLLTANIISLLFLIVYVLNVQFSGYLFIKGNRADINALVSVLGLLVMMACYCVANWCFTSLMDGKGILKEIYISMSFALKPYIYGGLILFALSWILSEKEIFIYTTVKVFLFVWIFGLLFFGMIMTHDYSVENGIKTLVLTIIGMALIIFIVLVLTNLVEDMFEYVYGIYREFSYRNL